MASAMAKNSAFLAPHISAWALMPLMLLAAAEASGQRAPLGGPPGPLPPGVQWLPSPPQPERLPPDIDVRGFEVDWTAPLLAWDLVFGLDGGRIPLLWSEAAPRRPAEILIQLVEPVEAVVEGRVAWNLPLETRPAPAPPTRQAHPPFEVDPPAQDQDPGPEVDHVRLGDGLPWMPAGHSAREGSAAAAGRTEGSAAVGVRWLGQPADWRTRPPAATPPADPLILSVLDPTVGRSRFFWIRGRSRPLRDYAPLGDWIDAAIAPHAWIALHATGGAAKIGFGEWRIESPEGGEDFVRKHIRGCTHADAWAGRLTPKRSGKIQQDACGQAADSR